MPTLDEMHDLRGLGVRTKGMTFIDSGLALTARSMLALQTTDAIDRSLSGLQPPDAPARVALDELGQVAETGLRLGVELAKNDLVGELIDHMA